MVQRTAEHEFVNDLSEIMHKVIIPITAIITVSFCITKVYVRISHEREGIHDLFKAAGSPTQRPGRTTCASKSQIICK